MPLRSRHHRIYKMSLRGKQWRLSLNHSLERLLHNLWFRRLNLVKIILQETRKPLRSRHHRVYKRALSGKVSRLAPSLRTLESLLHNLWSRCRLRQAQPIQPSNKLTSHHTVRTCSAKSTFIILQKQKQIESIFLRLLDFALFGLSYRIMGYRRP